MEKEKPKIACLPNGPYYLLNDMTPKVVPNIQKSNGESCTTLAGVALCRCGSSNNKPFCDGTHGKIGFTDEKLADGSLDKRTDYVGKRITIHDNRGICAHAGYCTDNLAAVFKLKKEPWIDPDGAAVEEIIDTIKKCPSGALVTRSIMSSTETKIEGQWLPLPRAVRMRLPVESSYSSSH